MALSYEIFGVSTFSARFFSVVFGALTILISYIFGRRYFGERPAIITVLVLLASIHFNFQLRMAVPDPYLIFFMTGAFMCFYHYLSGGRRVFLWLMYVCFGFGLLTKGPVALGLPGLIMLIFLIITRRLTWTRIKSFNMVSGAIITAAIALPWYWMNYLATNGEWTEGFFLKHNLQRFSDTMEGHGGFFLLPVIMVVAGLLPLGVFALQSVFKAIRNRRGSDPLLYCVCIVLGIVIFFSFSQTKLPNYTAPAYPFLALCIAWLLASFVEGRQENRLGIRWGYVFYTLVAFALPVAVFLALRSDSELRSSAWVAICFIFLPLGAILGWLAFSRGHFNRVVHLTAGSFILTNILFFSIAYPRVYNHNPVSSSLELVLSKPRLVYYKMMNPAYIFNMQRTVPAVYTPAELAGYLRSHPDALVITRKQYAEELRSISNLNLVFEQRDTFEKPVTALYQLD